MEVTPELAHRARRKVGSTIADILLRILMSFAFLGMAWWWLCVVGKIINDQTVEKQIAGGVVTDKRLSDAVLIALLTTTTINVLGLLYFVANYLFPKQTTTSDTSTPKPPAPPPLDGQPM